MPRKRARLDENDDADERTAILKLAIMSPSKNNEGFTEAEIDSKMDIAMDLKSQPDGDHVSVTIVGAGPAGLMLASNLVRYGIKTAIVDDRPDRTETGRADGLQPKSIETFRQLGLADELLHKGARIYDICFWAATDHSPLRRIGREIHYPPGVVDVEDPFILLVHQGMVEEVFIKDLRLRGVEVLRSTPFVSYSIDERHSVANIEAVFDDKFHSTKIMKSQFLVGCDGAHSKVRKVLLGGETGIPEPVHTEKSAWGVLDGIIETDFPDLWSKAVVSNETEGSVLCIPRERNMTRLYIELHQDKEHMSNERATQEFVMQRAKEIVKPFKLEWKTVEWFGIYKVGQRVAKRFSDDHEKVFIAGDAAHTHSPKAAQGMNVSMHDAFNLSWKLNLAVRGLAQPTLLKTYEQERRKIAQDLINFDYEHANAFAAGDPKALAANFAKNIRFISGVGAEYAPNVLNIPEKVRRGGLRGGSLMLPAKVTRYIDANPVDLQLDIPMLGQFRVFFFTHNVIAATSFLTTVCSAVTSPATILGRASIKAAASYAALPQPETKMDIFMQPKRYLAVSKIFTYALVTTMSKPRVEISDLPQVLQDSRWTFYLDNIMHCTEKWLGALREGDVAIVNMRPDGYVGNIGRWNAVKPGAGEDAVSWLDRYYGQFLKA